MNATTGLASIFILTLVAGGAAQTKARGKTKPVTLAQAVVVEIYEHNLGKAIAMYRTIAADQKRTEDTRTQAFLRLGKAYRRLGQAKEAEANLQKAAQGRGDAAKEAAMLLSGEGVEDGDLVKAKVKQALAAMRLTGKPDRSDLGWIGQPAVPYVVKANKEEKADLRFLQNTATVLCQLGGPEVLKWIEETRASDDVLRKRAVIKGYRGGDRMVRAKLATFMTDKDVTVRREVIYNPSRVLTAKQFIAALKDADEAVRSRAVENLRGAWQYLDHEDHQFENFVALLPTLETLKSGSNTYAQNSLDRWLQGLLDRRDAALSPGPTRSPLPSTDAGRRAFFRAARLSILRRTRIVWPKLDGAPAKNSYLREFGEAAKASDEVIGSLSGVLPSLLPTWEHEALPTILDLAQRGYDAGSRRLSSWVAIHGKAEDVPAVADVLAHFDASAGVGQICQWMSRVKAPEAVLPQLIQLANRFIALDPNQASSGSQRLRHLLMTIRSVDNAASVEYLVSNMLKGRRAFYRVIEQRLNHSATRAILRRMLVAPDKTQTGNEVRQYAFFYLIRYHDDPGDPRDFARAYEIGMGETGPAFDPGIGGQRTDRGLGKILTGGTKAKTAVVAKILDACLATGQVEAFKDLASSVSVRPWRNHAIGAALARNMSRCPELQNSRGEDVRGKIIERILRAGYGGDALVSLELKTLTHKDASVRRSALNYDRTPTDPRIVKALMVRLKDDSAEDRQRAARRLRDVTIAVEGLIPAMTSLLDAGDVNSISSAIPFLGARAPDLLLAKSPPLFAHENSYVRYLTAKELLARHGSKVIEQVGKVLLDKDIDQGYRKSLIKPFGSLMDLKVVPHLLNLLKEPGLQADAQQQLEAVRFYHEQSSKWSRLMEGSGFTETTAVEALIKQVKSGNKEVRLAAIASLGTVADPESLPLLVQLIADSDREIRKAAKDAVNRINSAGRKKK